MTRGSESVAHANNQGLKRIHNSGGLMTRLEMVSGDSSFTEAIKLVYFSTALYPQYLDSVLKTGKHVSERTPIEVSLIHE